MTIVSGVEAVLTDIEGTTSSIAFVHEVLFPHARRHLADHVRQHEADLGDLFDQIRGAEGQPDLSTDQIITVLLGWMDEDRKATPLKELQGRIWRQGYEAGEIKGDIYPDAVQALQRWHAAGLKLHVYSSGSVEAQKLIFGHSVYGDLTPWFSGFFDTNIGGKLEAGSYTRIAVAIGLMPRSILFLSDNPEEVAAAGRAGMQTIRLMRDEPPEPGAVASFADIEIGGQAT